MNYITQYISESQLKYSNIFPKPVNVLSHLFFTNGNGVDFIDNNPVVQLDFEKYVPFTEYYKVCSEYSELYSAYVDRYLDVDIHRTAKQRADVYSKLDVSSPLYQTPEDIHRDCTDEAHQDLNNIEQFYWSQHESIDYWVTQIRASKYFPLRYLSAGYFDLEQVNENTEPLLFKLATIIVSAYIKFYENALENADEILKYEYPYGSVFEKMADHVEDMIKYINNDLDILKLEYTRLTEIADNNHEN